MTWRVSTLVVLLFFCVTFPARATVMDMVSDLISTSAPSVPAEQRIQFTTIHATPPSGAITVTFVPGAFTVPAGFDYTDVDLAVWDGSAYIDRPLAATADATNDGVSVVTGTSGSVTITLSSSAGIPAGSLVQVRLGTNAVFGATGTDSVVNPPQQASYRIGIVTTDASNTQIDYATAMIAVVLPVTLTVPLQNIPPQPFGGLPAGTIAAGNRVIELSFSTDRTATCRYATTTGETYSSMTGRFTPNSGIFFYTVVSGHLDGTTYTYYVRCIGVQGAVSLEYPISFSLASTPTSNTSVTQSGGVVGTGSFQNGSSVLYLSNVTLSGFSSPGSTVRVLKDGVLGQTAQASANGSFQALVGGIERGTYTFLLYAVDSKQRKSATFSSTLALDGGTNTTVSGIVLPPTTATDKSSVALTEKVQVVGEAPPGSKIEVLFSPLSSKNKSFTATTTAQASAGTWQVDAPGSALSKGSYSIRATAAVGSSQSDPSTPLVVGVGEAPSSGVCAPSDINGDGKVNLIDFSILLTGWNTSTAKADLNCDGTVNLADFSILLFNWTG